MYMNMYTNMNMYSYVSEAWPTNLSSSMCRKISLSHKADLFPGLLLQPLFFFPPSLNILVSLSRLTSLASNPPLQIEYPSNLMFNVYFIIFLKDSA